MQNFEGERILREIEGILHRLGFVALPPQQGTKEFILRINPFDQPLLALHVVVDSFDFGFNLRFMVSAFHLQKEDRGRKLVLQTLEDASSLYCEVNNRIGWAISQYREIQQTVHPLYLDAASRLL